MIAAATRRTSLRGEWLYMPVSYFCKFMIFLFRMNFFFICISRTLRFFFSCWGASRGRQQRSARRRARVGRTRASSK